MKTVVIPIPSYGFDPSETAIPWKYLTDQKIRVRFATPDGSKAKADAIMLTGQSLGIWKRLLAARKDVVAAHYEMERSEEFNQPIRYSDVAVNDHDGILLPGGHDKAVREYLESPVLQSAIVDFFNADKAIGAICHGVVLVARSVDPRTQRSVLYDRRTTALLKSQELTAWRLTRFKLKDYYRTYPTTVQDEVVAALRDKNDFVKGPLPKRRDDFNHLGRGFAVRDLNYVSARWPGDVYNFAIEFGRVVDGR